MLLLSLLLSAGQIWIGALDRLRRQMSQAYQMSLVDGMLSLHTFARFDVQTLFQNCYSDLTFED